MDREIFYKNVFLLTQAEKPSKPFQKHFKEGMFDKPNTLGFQLVSHYLLMIYDAERFGKQLQWPLLCKQSEVKFRNDVKDFLTTIAKENPDIDFPQILASHLLHASGSKFNAIMANLSTVTLRTWIKRKNGTVLLCPKPGPAEELSKTMLKNMIARNIESIENTRKDMVKKNSEAMEYINELVATIKSERDELFSTRQRIHDLAAKAPTHPSIKTRLEDPNDVEIIQLWKGSFNEGLQDLKRKQASLMEISELSTNVANIVKSIVSDDTDILDGKQLSSVDVSKLSEIKELSPETQVMLCRQHENETLVLQNFLSLFNCVLNDLLSHIKRYGFPNFFGCESQILASCEDAKSMNELFNVMYEQIEKLASHQIPKSDQEACSNSMPCGMYQDLFDSVLLKSSPTININLNLEPSGNEFRERLELTPVEHVQRTLFSRHKRIEDNNAQAATIRPRHFAVSRINLDDTRISFLNERSTPFNVNVMSRRLDESDGSIEGRYSRLFSTRSKRTTSRLNLSVRPLSSSSRQNSLLDMNATCDVYSASQLRSHLAKNSFPENPEFFSPKKLTPTEHGNACASSTIIQDARSASSTTITESADGNKDETKTEVTESQEAPSESFLSPKPTEKVTNRRLSISDLVERYRRVCGDRSIAAKRINSSDYSEEGEKD